MLDQLSMWLREQRLARGWSVAEMGRRLQQAARSTGDHTVPGIAILASYVRRWEKGIIGLTERYQLHYCTAFGIPPAQFGPPALPGEQPGTGALAPRPASRDVTTLRPGVPPGRREEPADLTGWLAGPGGYRGSDTKVSAAERPEEPPVGSADLLIAMIAEESLDFGEWADTSNVADATLENYARQVRQLADDYQHEAPYPLLLETSRLRDRVFAKLRGHQRPDQASELYLIAAQVCGLLAWMAGDLSHYRAADAHAWTGWVCAEHADHDGARTWLRVTQSKLAYWQGRFAESAQLAEDGLGYQCPDSGQVMAAIFQARALARLGRHQEAAGALGDARDRMDQAGQDEVGGLWSVIPARFHSLAGNVQVWQRDPGQVLAETALALEQFEAADPRDHNYGAVAHARIDQARAHLLLADLDGADNALRPVLSLAPESRYEPVTQHLAQLRQALAQPDFRDAPVARQLQDEIETYCRESIINGLTP